MFQYICDNNEEHWVWIKVTFRDRWERDTDGGQVHQNLQASVQKEEGNKNEIRFLQVKGGS